MPSVIRRRPRREQKALALPQGVHAFRRRLLGWYGRHQRALPWRGTRDPYAVLVSEFMLQQTQVSRVMGHYPRFLTRYPTIEDLAAAPADAVRESWHGLGYYARARNLHAAARRVVADHGGRLPRELERLRKLPGIGRYTAHAVASLGFGADVATVDTNIDRVLGRVFKIRGAKKSAARARRVWSRAEVLVPRRRSADWNQALMDLGATICVARRPRCEKCPVATVCRSRRRLLTRRSADEPSSDRLEHEMRRRTSDEHVEVPEVRQHPDLCLRPAPLPRAGLDPLRPLRAHPRARERKHGERRTGRLRCRAA